ncbi:hypothetical protein H6P81_010484 [Aristolochia fimbriata]|uniref:Fiber protein Fb34 n=1 Tax=Aristolochia fimbriata TaxID=158543 RepID=A0AAV7EQ36_ARIFI|nr:hypothetical protein H6P81_010484 [Aristolochia fimbriata]
MALSLSVLAVVSALYLIAFVLAVGAERRRSFGKPVPDQYDDFTYCKYSTDASTVYGLSAFLAVLASHGLVTGVTKCLCFGRGLTAGPARTCAVLSFVLSWITFLAAEACLLAGSARNAYHTKYRARFGVEHLTCAELRKGVFAAGAALILLSMIFSLLFYGSHAKADTGGWQKHINEGVSMNPYPQPGDFPSEKP